MHRISTDKEYYESGTVILDADGIPVDLTGVPGIDEGLSAKADKSYVDAQDQALGERIDKLFPSSIRPGQVLRWDGTNFRPSWLDQHTNIYDNTY